MRAITKLGWVLALGAVGIAAACDGGGDQNDAGSDAAPDVTGKKDASKPGSDAAIPCSAASSYTTVANQEATFTPTPSDAGVDAAVDAAVDATDDGATTDGATTDASDDGATADASDDGAAMDASADGGVADAGGPIGGPEDSYVYDGTLDGTSDVLDIELYAGYGVFQNGIKLGTYTLAGSETDYGTCGLCVLVQAGGNDPYMATGGTVTITALQPTLTGTLTNVTFTHVSIDPQSFESTPLGDGCNTSIASLAISAPVKTGP